MEGSESDWGDKAWSFLSRVRKQSPLIQCITNNVLMDLIAHTLLSAGASPAMVHAIQEISDFTPITDALCMNVGTLTVDWIPAMKSAAVFAVRHGKPWVLDPVPAAGVSEFRLRACLELLGLKPNVIRGNGSEIIAVSSASRGSNKGADSLHESTDALEAAKLLAKETGVIVAVSGAVDIITDGERVIGVHNGVPVLQQITATGCAVTAFITAFVSADPTNALEATVSALSVFGVAGEIGMEQSKGPDSFRLHFLAALYGLDEATVRARVKVNILN